MIACVTSVVGTLVVVGLLFWCYKVRRKRNLAQLQDQYTDRKSFGKNNGSTSPTSSDTPLEIISPSRERSDQGYQDDLPLFPPLPQSTSSRRNYPNINTNSRQQQSSDPYGSNNSEYHTSPNNTKGGFIPNYSETWNTASSSSRTPISPINTRAGPLSRVDTAMIRGTSQEGLLRRSDLSTNSGSATSISSPVNPNNSMTVPRGGGVNSYDDYGQEDLPDLKLETLAQFGGSGVESSGQMGEGREVGSGSSRRVLAGRRQEDLEYVVHQDAGRVLRSPVEDERRVLELPPRYHELRWEEDGQPPVSPSSTTGTTAGMGGGVASSDSHHQSQPHSPIDR